MFHIGIAVQHPPLPEPHQLSELGIDFIRQCLDIDPDKRPSAEELMLHPWIQEATAQISAAYEEESTPTGSYSKASSENGYGREAEGSSRTIEEAAEEEETDETRSNQGADYHHQLEDGNYLGDEDTIGNFDADGIANDDEEEEEGEYYEEEDSQAMYEAGHGELGSLAEQPEEEEEEEE